MGEAEEADGDEEHDRSPPEYLEGDGHRDEEGVRGTAYHVAGEVESRSRRSQAE